MASKNKNEEDGDKKKKTIVFNEPQKNHESIVLQYSIPISSTQTSSLM